MGSECSKKLSQSEMEREAQQPIAEAHWQERRACGLLGAQLNIIVKTMEASALHDPVTGLTDHNMLHVAKVASKVRYSRNSRLIDVNIFLNKK